jgi:hypothetical protein
VLVGERTQIEVGLQVADKTLPTDQRKLLVTVEIFQVAVELVRLVLFGEVVDDKVVGVFDCGRVARDLFDSWSASRWTRRSTAVGCSTVFR